jgi:hypothetical protein
MTNKQAKFCQICSQIDLLKPFYEYIWLGSLEGLGWRSQECDICEIVLGELDNYMRSSESTISPSLFQSIAIKTEVDREAQLLQLPIHRRGAKSLMAESSNRSSHVKRTLRIGIYGGEAQELQFISAIPQIDPQSRHDLQHRGGRQVSPLLLRQLLSRCELDHGMICDHKIPEHGEQHAFFHISHRFVRAETCGGFL